MSRGSILPIPAGFVPPDWPPVNYMAFPRATWLTRTEDMMRSYYPTASSADLAATARSIAPFPLREPAVRP